MDIPIQYRTASGKQYELTIVLIEDKISGDYVNAIVLHQPINAENARDALQAAADGLRKLGY